LDLSGEVFAIAVEGTPSCRDETASRMGHSTRSESR
jgi:hypothetical protein